MAPLAQALQVFFQSKGDDGTCHYRCELDPSWAVLAVPQGGYSLGVIVEACIQHQAGSSHRDPIYVSAHFLRATNAGVGGHVQVKLIKSGKTFSNILAELVQQVGGALRAFAPPFLSSPKLMYFENQETTKIAAHLVFGDLSPSQPGRDRGVLVPPSPYARRVPLYSHPSTAPCYDEKPRWMRKMQSGISVDAILLSHNDPGSTKRTATESVGGGGVEWGAWCELTHKDDKLTTSSVPFFCDTFVSLPELLPESEPGSAGRDRSWFPTIAMTLEFKARIPSPDNHSTRTVGVYSESRFLNDPDRRHNARVEVWTAPSQIGQGNVAEGWRDHQYCIAVADQMALMVPAELNLRQGTRDSAKL